MTAIRAQLLQHVYVSVALITVQVETIGDAYMVVGGLPIRSDRHAENVCNQALDMLHYCKQVRSPVDGKPINVIIIVTSAQCFM